MFKPNPYRYSAHVDGNDFYGRVKLVDALLTSKNKLIWLRGNRRVGKTSTLYHILYSPEARTKYLIYFLDFGGSETYKDWSNLLRSAIFDDNDLDDIKKEIEIELNKHKDSDFFELQRLLAGNARRKNLQLLLLCDEVEAWIDTIKEDPKSGTKLLRNLRREWEKLDMRVILTATGRLSSLMRYDDELNSQLLPHTAPMFIAQFNQVEAVQLIEQSNNNEKIFVDDNTKTLIISRTGKHPFLIQYLCHEHFQDGKITPTKDDGFIVSEYLSQYFDIDFNGLTIEEKKILIELAKLNSIQSECVKREILQFQTRFNNHDFDLFLNNLKQLGMIDDCKNNRLTINNYFLFRWLINNAKSSRGKEDILEKAKSIAPKIFVSYSHKDESFKDELVTMLAGLQRRGVIDTWQDRRIESGAEWFDAIHNAMKECNMALLLVSPDFVASRFIQEKELAHLFQRRVEEGLRVVPIIVRPCLWQSEPVIKDLQALPKDGKPVISFSKENGDRDQVWAEIGKVVENFAQYI